MSDFGAVNTVSYHNALTNEVIAKLDFKKNVMGVVTNVVSAYRQLVQDYNNLAIQERFLKESAESLRQYMLKVKVGKMAPSDILQQKASLEKPNKDIEQKLKLKHQLKHDAKRYPCLNLYCIPYL